MTKQMSTHLDVRLNRRLHGIVWPTATKRVVRDVIIKTSGSVYRAAAEQTGEAVRDACALQLRRVI